MCYIDRLIENCQKAKTATPIREFVLKDLSDLSDLSELKDVKQAVYVIEEIGGDSRKTFDGFKEYRKQNERKCAKLNSPSKIMYVGSSTTGVKRRIKEHQGEGHAQTYSLHLKYWFKGCYKITIKEYDESREVLQIIEDALAEALQPAFGKRGGNNR